MLQLKCRMCYFQKPYPVFKIMWVDDLKYVQHACFCFYESICMRKKEIFRSN